MKLIFAFVFIALTAGVGAAEHSWVNNITVNEYNMTWRYTETFTGVDSIAYRISIDSELGNNDSFVSAWELLKADKEMRRSLRSSIDKEQDVRINNMTRGIEVFDVDSMLSPATIGKTHSSETIVNRYNVTYRFGDSVLNASSIWFLGQANTPVTITMPAGIDIINKSGMKEVIENRTDHAEISGFFIGITKERGEITLFLSKNTSYRIPRINVSNATSPAGNGTGNISGNLTEPVKEIASKIRDTTIIIAAVVIIILIYVFKVKKQ